MMDGEYFGWLMPAQFHSRAEKDAKVFVMPFCLEPENWKPTGSINFSRIDTSHLNVTAAAAGTLHVYARAFNVLKVVSGMGGKRFAS